MWLRDCVYKRVTKKGRKPGSKESMATFLTSAVWVSFPSAGDRIVLTSSMVLKRDTIVSHQE